jgi:hypothetical protein
LGERRGDRWHDGAAGATDGAGGGTAIGGDVMMKTTDKVVPSPYRATDRTIGRPVNDSHPPNYLD